MAEDWRSIPLVKVMWPIRQLYSVAWEPAGVSTLGELASMPARELHRIPGCGPLSKRHILATIAKAIEGGDVCAPEPETVEQMAVRQYGVTS